MIPFEWNNYAMNGKKKRGKQLLFLLAAIGIAMMTSNLTAETLYLDGRTGSDASPGTEDQALQTAQKMRT